MSKVFFTGLFLFITCLSHAQKDSVKVFDLSLEFRPRFEFRDGYRQLPFADTDPAFFVSSRSRLNLNYKTNRKVFHMSVQDVRIWGQDGSAPAPGSFNVFETYASFDMGKAWHLKLGRQAVELDNGRLFSEAKWNQFSRAHDGIRLRYQSKKLQNNLMLFYNQQNAGLFGTNYSLNFYKYLANHYLIYKPNKNWAFKVLNSFDGYQSPISESTVYVRGTSGGRIEYRAQKLGATIASYYQYGQLSSGQNISAYYIQPELNYKAEKLKIRLGAEYLSGDNGAAPDDISRSFSTLYGVAFKFMGHLNYFTTFPHDVRGGGLINPYLFFDYSVTKKLRVKLETHLFLTQNNVLNTLGEIIDPYLGTEFDLKLKYTLEPNLVLDFGVSSLIATESLSILKTGDHTQLPVFSFLMLTWKPNLIHLEKR